MRATTITLCLLLAAGAAGGCSDDEDGGGEAQPYVDALTEQLQSGDDGLEASDAECIAETSVDALGVDFLEENGVTPEDLAAVDGPEELDIEISEEQARAAAAAFGDCDISFGEAFAGEDGPQEAIDCVDETLDDDALVDAYAAQYLGDQEQADQLFAELLTTVQEECGDLLGG
jgi:hypothetical protein